MTAIRARLSILRLKVTRLLRGRGAYVQVSVFGVQKQLVVSVNSRAGMMTLQAWESSDANMARAGIYAQNVANITGLPLFDMRPPDHR
jgi:hypothetical protein